MKKNKVNSLYIHIPFCESICDYCDFTKLQYFRIFAKPYLEKLKDELSQLVTNKELKTIYYFLLLLPSIICITGSEAAIGLASEKSGTSESMDFSPQYKDACLKIYYPSLIFLLLYYFFLLLIQFISKVLYFFLFGLRNINN